MKKTQTLKNFWLNKVMFKTKICYNNCINFNCEVWNVNVKIGYVKPNIVLMTTFGMGLI